MDTHIHKTHVKCEKCGARAKRVFYPLAVIYKGKGFYTTDNKGK